MSFHARPISFKPPRLKGLSARLIASHYENNYGGAIRRLNAIRGDLANLDPASAPGFRLNGLKREELIATNSMLLHEAYFEALGEAGGGDPTGALAEAIARDFGSLAKWRADHTHGLAGGTPVLALDMYEHAYHIDFGSNAAAYVDAFMNNIAWERVANRFAGAQWQKKPHTVDAPTARAMLEADPDLLVIDARLAEDAATVPVGLRGARRAPPDKVDEVAASLPRGAKALVYCAWGFEIGGDCAAKLRERGIDAVAVAGGIGTWRADGLPTEPLKEGDRK
jgi:Fe-Mn family superoxide dismutase